MLTRIITGVVGIGLAAFVIQTGGALFAVCGILLAIGGWYEYCRAFRQKGYNPELLVGGVLVALMVYSSFFGLEPGALTFLIMLAVLLLLILTVLRHSTYNVPSALASIAGVLYLGLPFAHFVALRNTVGLMQPISTSLGFFDAGCALVWVALIGTWASDTFAYFAGSFLGKHKLCPSISPGKTREGFIGGLIGTTASVAGLGVFFGFDVAVMALLGFCICLVATVGDLVESVMKRYAGIKDSGNLIPGHGGVWDRFDSVLFTVPFVYYFVHFVSIVGR